MSLQHHFIVFIEDGKVFIDYDSTQDRFYGGQIWNDKVQDWEDATEHYEEYETAQELLQDLLMKGKK